MKNKNGISIVNDGFIDYFYCYKLKNSWEYIELWKNLLNLKCSIVHFKHSDDGIVNNYVKKEFTVYLNNEKMKLARDIESSLQEEFQNNKDVKIKRLNDDSNQTPQSDSFLYVNKIRLDIIHSLEEFHQNSIKDTIDLINENSTYFRKNLNLFNYNALLQPIKLKINDEDFFVKIRASVYGTGNIILQYSIPLKNISFFNLSYVQTNFNFKVFIPKYIAQFENTFDYVEVSSIEQAIESYNKFLIENLNIDLHFSGLFTNYTLMDYSNKPSNFDSISKEGSRDLFWLVNSPFGYANEQESIKYKEFIKNRLSISLYCSMFISTNGKTIIAYNNETIRDADFSSKFDNGLKYKTSMIFASMCIELLMIKQSFYKEISKFDFTKNALRKDLIKQYKDLLAINTNLFSLTMESYGSIKTLIDFLEKNSTDFLPLKSIETLIENHKENILLIESEKSEQENHINSIIAALFPVFLGLSTVESVTKILDDYILEHSTMFITHFNDYFVQIWLCMTVFILFLIYKRNLNDIYENIKFKIKKHLRIKRLNHDHP